MDYESVSWANKIENGCQPLVGNESFDDFDI